MQIKLDGGERVTATRYAAKKSQAIGATLILAHGAGADQHSDFMVSFARGLAARGVEVWTFNFLYTEQGRKAPDRQEKLEACYRAVIAAIRAKTAKTNANRLFIGGKSMGGRIASQVAAASNENLSGLVFLGYPLHPPGKPEQLRAEHLARIKKPMLVVQGERDPFGTPDELRPILTKLKPSARLYAITGGDHSFTVPKKRGIAQEAVYAAALDEIRRWVSVVRSP